MSANPLEGFEIVEFNGGIRPVSDPDAVLRKVFPGIAANSTYRPPNHPLSQKNPTSYHTTTHGAIDVSPIPGVSFEAYLQAYKNQGYHIIEARDEVRNPSKNATGPHWHVVLGLPNTEDAPAPGPDDFNFDRDYEIIEAKDDIVVKGKGIPAPKDIPVPVTQTENVAQFVDSPSEVQPMDPEVEKQYLQMVYDPSIPYEDVQRFAQRYGKNPDFESFNEIRKYIADNPDTFKVVPPNYINAPYAADVPTDGATGATIRGVANGVVANLLEEFGAAADTLIGTPGRPSVWNSDKRLADLYQENLFRNQDITGYDREAHPVASYGGEFGGGIVGFGKAKNLADLAMIGSAYGAVVGFGEQGAFTDRLTNAGIGSVTGGVASVALGAAVMAAAKRLGKPLDQVLPEEVIADDVDQVAPDIAAALKEDPLSIDKALESAPPSLKARLKSGVSQESVAAGQQPIPPKRNSVGEITKTVSKITSEWKNTPEFNIVQNVDELPKAVRGALRRNNAREVFGFVDPEGKVTIIGDNIKDPDMIPAIVFHESLGHLGLRNKFGKDLDAFLENLYKTNHDIRNRTKTWLESRSNTALYRNSPAPLARAVEEQLAMMSEEGVISPSLMDRIVAWFRAFGRKHGMSLRYTDGEVRNILALAHKTITDGTNANETVDGLRFIYAGRGSKTADVNAYENAVSAREMGVDKEPYTSDEHIDPDNYLFQYMSPQEMKSRGKAGNINLDNMETTEDIDNILKQYAQEVVPDPSRSLDETEALARLLGMTKSKLVKLRPNFTDVELTAARQVLVDHAEVLSRLGDAAYGPGPERGSLARIERFQKAVIAHKAIQEKVMNLVGQAGRTLNAAKIKVGTEEGRAISRALREADLGQLDDPDFLEILAKNIWAASNDPGAVGTVIDQALKPLPEDYFISGRQSLMLSGHKTHIKNIMGNIVSIFQDNAEQIVASGLGQFRRGRTNDRVFFRGAIMRPAMMLQTLFEGAHWSRVSQSWRESHPYHQVSKYENGRLIFEGAAAPLQIPYRALAAEDAMFRSMIENANFYEQAVRRVADTNPQTWAEWADRVDELRKNPTPEMIKESDLHTSVLQLIDDPTVLGKSINILKSRPNDPKTVKGYAQRLVRFLAYQLLPFHSVADRIFMHNVRRIPIVGLLDRVNLEDIAAGGARRDLAIARQIMGIAYIGAIWELGSLAADLINGSEDNYRKAKQEEGENRLPQSFRVGDQWISYAGLDQLGISLTAISDLRKKYDRGELSEEDAISNAINMMPAITKAMKESTFMEQLGEFFEALGSDPLSKNARENWIAGYVSSFVPGIVRQTNQTFVDDKVRDSTGDGTAWGKIKGRVKSGIPGLSDDLPQKYDVYGRPLDRKGQSTIGVGDSKPVENNPTIKEIARLSLEANENKAVVTPADRRSVEAIVGKNADASVVQEFQKRSGEFLLQNLTDLMATDEYQNADDPTKLKMVKKTVERSRKEIREQMVEESFDFDSEFEVVE